MSQSNSSMLSVVQARSEPSSCLSVFRQMRMPSTLSVAEDLERRGEEAQHDAAALALGLAARVAGQDVDVLARGAARGVALEPGAAELVELDVAGVDVDVRVGHLAQLQQLGVGEGGLGRAAPAEHDDLADVALGQDLEGVVGHVGGGELVAGEREHAGDVGGHVAVPDHHGALPGEVELDVAVVGVAVVPGDELGGGPAARQVLAGDAHATVGLGADRVDHRVVAGEKVVVGEVGAVVDVAVEAEFGVGGGLLVDAADGLDVGVVGGDAAAHEAPRSGEAVVDVDLDLEVRMGLALQEVSGRVEARRPGADDGHAQGAVGSADGSHSGNESRRRPCRSPRPGMSEGGPRPAG